MSQLFNSNTKKHNKENIYYLGKNNIENIQIKNIKIENSSNLGFLYNFQNNTKNLNNEIGKNKNKYIIIIYIEGCSVNVSLIYTLCGNDGNINRYEIKGINWSSFGEEDFTDNFENFLLNKRIKEECFKYPSSLSKLRKSFENIKKRNFIKNLKMKFL